MPLQWLINYEQFQNTWDLAYLPLPFLGHRVCKEEFQCGVKDSVCQNGLFVFIILLFSRTHNWFKIIVWTDQWFFITIQNHWIVVDATVIEKE